MISIGPISFSFRVQLSSENTELKASILEEAGKLSPGSEARAILMALYGSFPEQSESGSH